MPYTLWPLYCLRLNVIINFYVGVLSMKTSILLRTGIGAAALAASMSSYAYNLPIPAGNGLFSDNSAEYLINKAGSAANDTTVDVGDRLHGIFLIDDISGASILSGSPYDELSGIFDITVKTVVQLDVDLWKYTFEATTSFATDHGFAAGTAMAWYTDPTHEFARETNSGQTTSALEALITDGSLLWTTGFTGDAFWTARIATNDIKAISTANAGGGQFIMGLNLTQNNSGLDFNKVNCINGITPVLVDQCANGGVLTPSPKTGNTTPYDVWDDVNFNMDRKIPEPSTLALLGISLLSMGASRRKARS